MTGAAGQYVFMKQIQSGRRVDGRIQPTTRLESIAAAAPWAWAMSMREGAWAETRQTLVFQKKPEILSLDWVGMWVSKQCAITAGPPPHRCHEATWFLSGDRCVRYA